MSSDVHGQEERPILAKEERIHPSFPLGPQEIPDLVTESNANPCSHSQDWYR